MSQKSNLCVRVGHVTNFLPAFMFPCHVMSQVYVSWVPSQIVTDAIVGHKHRTTYTIDSFVMTNFFVSKFRTSFRQTILVDTT